HYASEVHWAFHTDIDEYFFSPAGTPPGFLRHYLQKLPNTTVQVLVQNMFFLGDPIGSDTNTLLEHYTHRMPTSSGRLRTKPIAWLPLAVHLSGDVFISPHQWPMMENGRPPLVDTGVLRLNHYWGDRAGVISDNTPDYRIDVTMMSEYGDGLVKDESAKPMGVWLRQRMQVAWTVISAQAVHKERKRLRKRVAEVKTRVRQLEALVPPLLNEGGGKGVRREGNERDMEEERSSFFMSPSPPFSPPSPSFLSPLPPFPPFRPLFALSFLLPLPSLTDLSPLPGLPFRPLASRPNRYASPSCYSASNLPSHFLSSLLIPPFLCTSSPLPFRPSLLP
ncbi:unnamed protein product, partial [Closterium sp. NIES-65]